MKNKKVTLKELASELGVTAATISKALRDSSEISTETKKRVKETAKRMGYQPNMLARSLVNQRSYLLGVLVPDLRISFFSEVTRGIYERARPLGYESIIVVNDENIDNEKRNLDFLFSLRVDGVLIDAVPGDTNFGLLKRMNDNGIKIVCYDRMLDALDFSSVTIDDAAAAFKLVQYFVEHSRRNILLLGPTEGFSVAAGRYSGYRTGLEHFGLEYKAEMVVKCRVDDYTDAEQKMALVLQKGIKIDAVMCVGGLIAYGAGRAIQKARLNIPNDIMLSEFGDNHLVHRLGVPFITINQSPYEMGQKAVDLVIKLIENKTKSQPTQHIIIENQLICRRMG